MEELNNQKDSDLSSYFQYQQTDQEMPIDMARLIRAVKKSWLIGLILLFLCLGSVYLYLRYTKQVFESSSVLKLDVKSNARILGITTTSQATDNFIGDISGEIEIIRSGYILNDVIEKLNLGVSYYSKGEILDEERYLNSPFLIDSIKGSIPYNKPIYVLSSNGKKVKVSIGEKTIDASFNKPITINGFEFVITPQDLLKEVYNQEFYFIINRPSSSIAYLQKNLSVSIQNASAHTIKIVFKDYNSFKAKDIIDAIDDVYLKKTLTKKQLTQDQTIQFIDEQLDKTEQELSKAEKDLENFLKTVKTVNPRNEFSSVVRKVEVLEEESLKRRLELNLMKDLKRMITENKELNHFFPILENMGSPTLITQITNLNTVIANFNKLKQSQKETTSAYQRKQKELLQIQENILTSINRQENIASRELKVLNSEIKDLQQLFSGLPSNETKLNKLKRYYNLYEKFYLMLKQKRVEFEIAKAGTVPEFTVLSPATLSKSSISPQSKMIYTVSIILGLAFLVLQIIFRYLLDNTILTKEGLERQVNAPVLGAVSFYKKEVMIYSKLVVHKSPKSSISESLRTIRTNLDYLKSSKNTKCQLISVTSTISGEGKTFVAINLGGILAFNQKVLIIDLDMRKPKLHLGFDGNNDVGMSTLLLSNTQVDDAIKNTEIENLHYISSGPVPPNPSELILRECFSNLLNKLKDRYDTIIIDTPPIGLVTDGLLVMEKVDIPLYIVKSGYSKRSFTENINKIYSNKKFKKLGVILNAVDDSTRYGYGYGYYEEDNE